MAKFCNQDYNYPMYTGPHFLCYYCQMMFISKEFLDKHQKKCVHMKLHFTLKIKLHLKRNTLNKETHYLTKSETSDDYFCEECFCGFLEISDYEKHMRDHHSVERPFQCKYCDRTFLYKSKLQRHIVITHQTEKPVKYDVCLKSFEEKSEMLIHNRNPTVELLPFDNPNCSKKYTSKDSLIQYLIPSVKNTFVCNHCEKLFSHKGHFKQHLLTHSGVKAFTCDICKKSFSQKSNLKHHLLIHSGEKQFSCDYCKKRFLLKYNLSRHMMSHTGEKPFGCDHCEKRFAQKTSLKLHWLTHFEKRPFDCDHCKKPFS